MIYGKDFGKSITLKESQSFSNLLEREKDYIQYEDHLKSNEIIFENPKKMRTYQK